MSARPAEVVRRFMQLMEPMDYDNALKLIAPDCDYINPPPVGAAKGPAGVRAVLEPFFAPMARNEFIVLREVSEGAKVVLERLDRHLLGDKWIELPVTGVYEVRDGLITYWREYFDVSTIMSQMPAPQG